MNNLELLAEAQHKIWASWVNHQLEYNLMKDGSIRIPAEKVADYKELASIPYEQLSDEQQQKDRDVVYEHLSEVPIIRDALAEDGEGGGEAYNLYSVQASGKKILSLDFDGVCSIYREWVAADIIPDAPTPYLFESLYAYYECFHICIFSSRSHQRGGRKAMMEWFEKHHTEWFDTLTAESQIKLREFPKTYTSINPDKFLDCLFFPTDKPKAFATLDDRAITFDGQFPQVSDLLEFVPWNRNCSARSVLGDLKYKGIDANNNV